MINKITEFNKSQVLSLLFYPFLAFLFAVFYYDNNTFSNLVVLLTSPALLVTDYLINYGISATMLSVGLVSIVTIIFFYKMKIPTGGLMYATFFIVFGFAFIGINIFNTLPLYIGGYLYSKAINVKYKDTILVIMLSGTIAPIVSHIAFGYGPASVLSVALSMIIGIVLGFLVFPLGKHVVCFHKGYNLYNVGFLGGIISIVYYSFASGFGYYAEKTPVIPSQLDYRIVLFLSISIAFLFLLSLFNKEEGSSTYTSILKFKSLAKIDYPKEVDIKYVFMNMAILGVISSVFILLNKASLDGLMLAAIFTIIGFGAFGKQPINSSFIVFGATLAMMVMNKNLSSTATLTPIMFSTTLAPITDNFGWKWGILAGFMHSFISSHVSSFYEGLNLYNNGFAGGLVAALIIVLFNIYESIKTRKQNI